MSESLCRGLLLATTLLIGIGCDGDPDVAHLPGPGADAPAGDAPVDEPPAAPGPAIAVEEAEFQLGDLNIPLQKKVTFNLSNTGSRPLEIKRIEVTCTCADVAPERSSIPPGEGAALDVMLSVDEVGPHTAQIVLHTNDPVNPRLRLLVGWNAKADVEATPSRVEFGGILPGETGTFPATAGPLTGEIEIVLARPEPRTVTILITAFVSAAGSRPVEEEDHADAP